MFNMPQFHNAAKLLLVGWIFYAVLKALWDESGMRFADLPLYLSLIILVLTIVYVVRNFFQNQDDNEGGTESRDNGSGETMSRHHVLIGRLVVLAFILGILVLSYLMFG